MLCWHLQEGRSAIPKSTKPARIAENFDVVDFKLSPEQLAAIDAHDTGDARRTGTGRRHHPGSVRPGHPRGVRPLTSTTAVLSLGSRLFRCVTQRKPQWVLR